MKSNLSGEFTVANPFLVHDLKRRGLWDQVMANDLKYFDGSVQEIPRISAVLKAKYATAFEVDYEWMVEAASRRQKWIDMGQPLTISNQLFYYPDEKQRNIALFKTGFGGDFRMQFRGVKYFSKSLFLQDVKLFAEKYAEGISEKK